VHSRLSCKLSFNQNLFTPVPGLSCRADFHTFWHVNSHRLPINASASRRGGLRSATTSNLVIPRCRLSTYGTRAFSVAGPVCWNSLPDYLKASDPSFNCLRQQLTVRALRWRIRDIVDVLYKCMILTYLLTYLPSS